MVRALQRKLLRDLWHLRSQVFTTALVVAGGVGGFIGSLSAHLSLVSLRDAYYESGRFAQVFVTAKRVPQRIESELRRIPGVTDVETTVVGNVLVSLENTSDAMTGRVIALPAEGMPRMNRVNLKSGRWVEPRDTQGVLVGQAFAEARKLAIGDRVSLLMNGKYESFTIRGIAGSPEFIFSAAPGGFADNTRFGIFWIGRERLEAAYDMRGAFNYATFRLAHGAIVRQVIDAADRILEPYGGTGAYGRDDQLSHRALTQEINEQRVYAVVFPAVFFAVAVFLLNVLLSRHIATERTQIASLKAMGYSNSAIGMHFLELVMAIVALGVLLGIGVGAAFGRWMTRLYTEFFQFPRDVYQLAPWLILVAGGITTLTAIAATANAIRAVVRLPPAEAMHPPAPASFKPTLLDRLGLGHLYSPEVRMIVRELERRPVRAIVTSLGVASSVGVLVAGTWWGDAFDYLVHTEYVMRERPDAIIALSEPTGPAALHEIARLPGVLSVEGTRDVPVELRNGPYRQRVGVIGVEDTPRLRRVLDERLRPVAVLPHTIVITGMMARQLHVQAGQSVWVDPLEGTEPARLMPVMTNAGDFTGTLAYMRRSDAVRLAGDWDTYTTVRVRLDRKERDAFFRRVREIPRVASVGDKAAMLRYFRENTQRNLLVFTGILSAFAAAIAIGVVYNSARITLAEHAWELATLRVLGFRRGEVSRMLLGQLGVQVLIAIPIGCLLGYLLSALIVALIQGEQLRIPLVILPATYAYAALVTLAAGLMSALIVRRRIDRLDLIGVLKTRE